MLATDMIQSCCCSVWTSKPYLDSRGGAGTGRERPGPAGRDVEEDDEGDADEEEAA